MRPGAALLAACVILASPLALADLLAPYRGVWDRLAPEVRQRLEDNAAHWRAMTPAERQAFVERQEAFEALPAPERARIREAWAAWQALTPEEREQVAQAARRYRADVERQAAWREAHAALPADEAWVWLLGPGSGAEFVRLRPLFAFIPPGERDRTLRVMRELSPEALEDLEQLVRRMPAARREAFRREMLEQAPERREGWLREQRGR